MSFYRRKILDVGPEASEEKLAKLENTKGHLTEFFGIKRLQIFRQKIVLLPFRYPKSLAKPQHLEHQRVKTHLEHFFRKCETNYFCPNIFLGKPKTF